ncbi:diacylglycerol O-acyltransferase [Cyberlindnera jadinii NRRL Y-1542]|uniref:Diacylglycerol O-acyltransferase n=1 Tax=Cyberlindnera jadinii (strain ATCC 18201 / CBS 1600 / BCRC 20928 / JCM 3617 / NBRC 0987 / NRRL Y-1542) TaxID=983966 RepID=A0A1E4S028_CYBJN|nr:diacylglycerol acyltransferase [Cyberlindnera jadinii NRRL Y-1542]ODV72805.1 diacylglycerol acyltransferase [Cyberlindnera jadinii NRRL Y-1542]
MELKHRHVKPSNQDANDVNTRPDRALSNELKDIAPEKVPSVNGVKFAPLSRPLHRRLETAAVLWHTVSIPVFITMFFVLLAIPIFWIFMVPYIIYWIMDKSSSNGSVVSRYSDRMRNLEIWQHFCNFFPLTLYKTADIQPTWTEEEVTDEYHTFLWFRWKRKPYKKLVATGPQYIFALHPHGVVSISGFGGIGTNGAGWNVLFPGIKPCMLTLINQFYVPFYRDYLMSMGITSSSRKNALRILEQHYSVGIVVGGAQESLLARPGSNDIVLAKRKGFIKLALETGNTGVVPCYCFGENDLYNVVNPGEESWGRSLQFWLKRNFGFTIPFFHARGIFNYDFGLLPWRRRVTIVVGKPIMLPHSPNPNKVLVDHYHKLYVEALEKLFDEHKGEFLENGSEKQLNIVE